MSKENWPDWDVYIKGKCRCVYCGLDGATGLDVWNQLDIDHLIPKCRGGTNSPINKVVTCLRCNLMKGSYDPQGYESDPPKWVEPPDVEERKRLIEVAKAYIQRSRKQMDADFRQMLCEIHCEPSA